MKIESILNAMESSRLKISEISTMVVHDITLEYKLRPKYERRCRQYHTFRDRILRVVAERDARIVELEAKSYEGLIEAINYVEQWR